MKTERINQVSIRCYDNGGKTADRYTVCYMSLPYSFQDDGLVEAVGMSADPFHPQGFGQHCGAMPGAHLGKRIRFIQLPADCQTLVRRDLESDTVAMMKNMGAGRMITKDQAMTARNFEHANHGDNCRCMKCPYCGALELENCQLPVEQWRFQIRAFRVDHSSHCMSCDRWFE